MSARTSTSEPPYRDPYAFLEKAVARLETLAVIRAEKMDRLVILSRQVYDLTHQIMELDRLLQRYQRMRQVLDGQ